MNNSSTNDDKLKKSIQTAVKKLEKAKREKTTILAQTVYLGTLGFIFILPIIAGAYLGVWLDDKLQAHFSISWTINLIVLGIIVGAINVYLFMRER